jgi:DNA-binding transcriptional regulator YhcF (GntR family)
MTPYLTVETASPVPPYEQVRSQLAQLIHNGVLKPGERLPPVRQLAADLGLAVGTIARAYRELELSGQVHTRRGGGTRVTETAAPSTSAERNRILAAHATAYVAAARRLGVDDQDLITAVRHAAEIRT